MPATNSISKIFNQLEKFGFQVYNFNTHRSQRNSGIKGFPDHVIIGKGRLVFVEVKRKGDTMRKEQKMFREAILPMLGNKSIAIHYFIIAKDSEAKDIHDGLLSNTLFIITNGL